jgi:hypothetical protein
MTTTTPSTALVMIQPAFSNPERLALAGFLAAYRGLTREAYTLDLRQFTTWCRTRSLHLLAVRRADIEGFARDLEEAAGVTGRRRWLPGVGSLVAGPGSDLSEEPALGSEPAAPETVAAPVCPSGPVCAARASAIICRNTTSDRRRLRARIASIGVFPAATLRS